MTEETNNIIHTGNGIAVLNGGNALPGCPDNWEEAEALINRFNAGKTEDDGALWSFDCGFKLDYDGDIVKILSRFYPPKTHYGPTWDGKVGVYVLGEKVSEKVFDCQTIEELKFQVESHVKEVIAKLKVIIKTHL